MPTYLTDSEISDLVSVDDAARIIEGLFLDESRGLTEQTPMTELHLPRGVFRVKVGGAYGSGSYGLKAYLGNAGYRIFVYSLESGFEGLVEAYDLTEIRTGAVSAVATKYLARPDSQVPICLTDYRTTTPSIETPVPNLFLTDSCQLHPHDRTISGSFALGIQAARLAGRSLAAPDAPNR